MRQLLVVLYYKLRANLKGALEIRRGALTRDLGSLLVLGGFSVGIFFFARLVTIYLLQEAHIGLFLFHRFISMVLFVFFLAINLGNMIVAYSTFYKSDEVSFLLSQPISFEKIFIVKFLDNFFHSSSTLFIIGVAVLAGYGSVFEMPLTFYLFAMLGMVIPFMLLAAAVAVIVLLILIRLAAKVSPRRIIIGLLLTYLAAVFFYFQFTNPMQLTEQVMKFYPNVNEYFSQFDPKFAPYLPNHWLADSLYFIVRKDLPAAIPYIAVLLLATVASVLICLLVAHRLYYRTWLLARDLRFQRSPNKAQWFQAFDFQRHSSLRPQTEVLLKKDFWQFFREPSQWLHLLIMVFLVVIFVVSVAGLEAKMTIPFLLTVTYLVVATFNGFLIASIALRFVFPVISLEGESFWAIRSAPIPLRKIYMLKLVTSFILVFLIAEILSLLSNYSLRAHTPLLIASAVSSLLLSIGLVGLNLGAGAYFADYREKSAIRIASSHGASLTFLLSLGFLILLVSALFMPVQQYFDHIVFGRAYSSAPLLIALSVTFVISILMAVIGSYVGLRSLERDF